MNPRAALAVVAVSVLTGCSSPGSPGSAASCAGPQVTVTPTTVAAGAEVRVAGEFFWDDCYDTGQYGSGQKGTPPATENIDIRLVTSGDAPRTFVLGTVDADEDGGVDTTVTVPAEAAPGPARIEAGFGVPASVEVTAP